jgi:bifunctional non-homologous end joining protein LigD
LLAIDGDDTRKLPLLERKAALAKLLRKAKPGIRYSEHLPGDGRVVFDQACKPYRSGKSKSWLSLKNPKAPGYLRHAQS